MQLKIFMNMKTARELYLQDDDYSYVSDYQPMIDELGEIIYQVDDHDYQGDTRVFLKKNNQYGYLIFGWGSCSGCDALQACDTISEVQDLFDGMKNDVKWFNSLKELQEYFKSKDWELEYSWHAEETKRFIDFVRQYK